MKRQILILVLAVVSAICVCAALAACGGDGEEYSTLSMSDGIVYLTDFSVQYTSAEESPLGEINNSALSEDKTGSIQSYYYVMEFDIQMASDNSDKEWLTVELTVYDASVVEAIVNYANTSSTSAVTENGQTVITVKFSLPDKAKTIKAAELVMELKPQVAGTTDIFYSFSSDTKSVTGYEDEDTTVVVTLETVSLSKTSFSYSSDGDWVTGIGTKKGSNLVIRSTYCGGPVTGIYPNAFKGNTTITSITLPDSVTIIGESAFSGCTALESIVIPDSLTTIGASAFLDCNSLTNITIGGGVTSIGESAFENTAYYNDENNWQNGVLYLDSYLLKADTELSGSYSVNDATTVIANKAFENCTALTGITFGNGLITLGDGAFYSCESLANITIPDSVISIGDSAFFSCQSLVSIVLPDSVVLIGEHVFRGCISLESITLSNNLNTISEYAFAYCSALTSVTIPDSVTTIDRYAFYECDSLVNVELGHSVMSINEAAFKGCSSIESITIPSSVNFIGKQVFSGCKSFKSATFKNTNGWYAYKSSSDSVKINFSGEAYIATLLRQSYTNYYWMRSNS